jgi:hypothetical protein
MYRLATRLLASVTLLGVFAILITDLPVAFAQKGKKKIEAPAKPAYKADATKKVVVNPSIPSGKQLTAEELAKHIDSAILARITAEKTVASDLCTDEEFVRRLYLDITGRIPTAEQAVKFLDSKESNKRAKLIDELLAAKEYGTHMADVWQALLLPRNSDNRRLMQYYPHLVKFMEEKFNTNAGWDVITKEILSYSGQVDKDGPGIYWIANNSADKMTDNVTRMFLGVQLQCAQCHNHPFTDYKQDEYWGMAAFFLNVGPDGNPKGAAKNGGSISVGEKQGKAKRKNGLPESAKILPPKFLSDVQPNVKTGDPLRPVLANWLTTTKNPYFAKAFVNRMWGQLFGRGFTNPIDDMHDGNVCTNPVLLADLAQQFGANNFDIKYLLRAICNSQTYQRSSKAKDGNHEQPAELFAKKIPLPLTPEQTYDSLQMLVGSGGRAAVAKNKANQKGAANGREAFVNFFAAEDGADTTEYQAGIPQVLRLMNAPQINNASALVSIMKDAKGQGEIIEKLYLTVLSRRPTKEEIDLVASFVAKNKGNPREAFSGVLWALMNSSEFALNR